MITASSHASSFVAQHRNNMAKSLARRLQAAKARHDETLIAQLQREAFQLSIADQALPLPTTNRSVFSRIRSVWQQFMNTVMHWSDLKISEFTDARGQHWWYGYDPITGRAIYAESDNELRSWIETYYAGR